MWVERLRYISSVYIAQLIPGGDKKKKDQFTDRHLPPLGPRLQSLPPCWQPLAITIHKDQKAKSELKFFLPQATCLHPS